MMNGIELNNGTPGPSQRIKEFPAADAPVMPTSPLQLQATNMEISEYTFAMFLLVTSNNCQS